MEEKRTKSNLKTRFFGIKPVRSENEWMYSLITLEQDTDDSLEVISTVGPYYMIELDTHLKVAMGKEKQRIFKGLPK